MCFSKAEVAQYLEQYGHLHLHLDSGKEFAVSKGDTVFDGGQVHIDSRDGEWKFPPEKIEWIDFEASGPE